MTVVLDTAAVFDLLVDAPGAADIRDRLEGEVLFVPHQLDVEMVSVIRRHVLAGVLTEEQGQEVLADYGDLPVGRWTFARDLRDRALELRDTVSAYDAPFVTLAESVQCPLITRDARLSRSTGHGAHVEVF